MRLVTPAGEYVIDGLADMSRVTLTETVAFERACGVDYVQAREAMSLLTDSFRAALVAGDDVEPLWKSVRGTLSLASILWWMLWLCRHTAGERQPSGAPLTVEQAGDVAVDDISFRLDPGDTPKKAPPGESPPDPHLARRSGSERAGKSNRKPRPVSGSRTSTGKS